ncbi:hypothetical protein NQ317_013368, partial [Molorchus minor]
MRALGQLQLPVEKWDVPIVYLIGTKLDNVTAHKADGKNSNNGDDSVTPDASTDNNNIIMSPESSVNSARSDVGNVLLSTAHVEIYDRYKNKHIIRALLDNGSQSSFITSDTCKRLGIPKRKRCLFELANENSDKYPDIANVIKTDFYVDDLLTGVDTVENATRPLSVKEIDIACTKLLRLAQDESFHSEILQIKIGKLSSKSKLVSLNPYVDHDGMLRVGGRLCNAKFEFEKKHPLILCKSHSLTKLLVKYYHLKLFHAGPQHLLASLREKYWIVAGRALAKKTVRECMKQHIWERWSKEYVSELQQRCKWKQTQSELKEGTLVLLKEDNLPPMNWKLGRIMCVHRG